MYLIRIVLVVAAGLTFGLGATAARVRGDAGMPSLAVSPPNSIIADRGPTAAEFRLAQAGSTGGTLGKTDQELSGGPKMAIPERSRPTAKPVSPASISGKWVFETRCPGSEWRGEFVFEQGSDGILSGSCSGSADCSTVSGRVTGNKVNLTVTYHGYGIFASHKNNINLTLAENGKSMRGIEDTQSHGRCNYQVQRP